MSWMKQLSTTRRDEAIATFAHEQITREIFTLFKGIDGNYYVIGLNEADTTPGKSDSSAPINQEHAAIKKECLETVSERGEVLLDLSIH